MKILWHSNAPWVGSGYGKQTKLFTSRIKSLGHEVAVSAFWGLRGGVMDWPTPTGPMPVYPHAIDGHGNDCIIEHAAHFFGGDHQAGLTIFLTDIWVMHVAKLRKLNAAAWVPVDHEPAQPPTVKTLKDGRCIPIAMSRFGERMLVDEGLDPVYVPHGVETNVFAPSPMAEARAKLELPKDAFIVGMLAANQHGTRKNYAQAIRAFARFHESHPDSHLHLHSWVDVHHGGLDLQSLIIQEGIPHTAVSCCDQYRYEMGMFADPFVARTLSAMDVMLNPSAGEGFGVPIIEAQACGTPVIVTDWTSMPELVGSGHKVGGTPTYTSFQSWQKIADVDEIVHALEVEYAKTEAEALEDRKRAREFAVGYDADLVTRDYWVPALAEIEQRIAKRPRKKPRQRAAR